MIVKQHENKIYIFEKTTAMTGVFSGNELKSLIDYSQNPLKCKTDFINRLYNLGILSENSDLSQISKSLDIKSSSLDSLHIDIISDCPLTCSQCYKNNNNNSKKMSLEYFEKIITEAEKLKVFQIAIGGGEALIHPEVLKFIKLVSKTEMAVSVTTSAYNLSNNLIDKLIDAGLNHIQVSLNSIDKKINNLSRDGYENAVLAIKKLSKKSLSFGINMVIRKDNLKTFTKTVEFAKKYKAENINVLRYKPSEYENYETYSLNKEEFFDLAKKIKKIKGINVKVDSAYSNLLIYLNNGLINTSRVGCGAAKKFISITETGKFKACSHLDKEYDFDSITECLDKMICGKSIGKCMNCGYYDICKGCEVIGFDNCPIYQEKSGGNVV